MDEQQQTSGRDRSLPRYSLLILVLVLAVGAGACGGKSKKASTTTTTSEETTTSTTVLSFCERVPAFVQSATDVLGTELTQAKSDPAAYSKFRDDLRALAQSARDLSTSAPDEIRTDMSDIVTALDQVQQSADTSPTPTDPGFADVRKKLTDAKLKASIKRVADYVTNSCGTSSTTVGGTPGVTSGPGGTVRRGVTTTTRKKTTTGTTTTTRPGATTTTSQPGTTMTLPVTTTTRPPATTTTASCLLVLCPTTTTRVTTTT